MQPRLPWAEVSLHPSAHRRQGAHTERHDEDLLQASWVTTRASGTTTNAFSRCVDASGFQPDHHHDAIRHLAGKLEQSRS